VTSCDCDAAVSCIQDRVLVPVRPHLAIMVGCSASVRKRLPDTYVFSGRVDAINGLFKNNVG